jgi:hypothetical protein
MGASDGAKMRRVLERDVFPALAERGFRGKWPHLRRLGGKRIDLLSFQFDKWGGGFCVEVACCPATAPVDWTGRRVAAARITAQHLRERVRLGPRLGGDHWFRYDGSADAERFTALASEVLRLVEKKAEAWWARR